MTPALTVGRKYKHWNQMENRVCIHTRFKGGCISRRFIRATSIQTMPDINNIQILTYKKSYYFNNSNLLIGHTTYLKLFS